MAEQKFKVGDRVRCIEPGSYEMLKVGTTGVVVGEMEGSRALNVKTDEGFPTGYIYARRFEKIEEPPRKGDKVRVVIEGEVTVEADEFDTRFRVDGGKGGARDQFAWINPAQAVSIEVVERAEPEITEFRAGDLIRGWAGNKYLILEIDGDRQLTQCLHLGASYWEHRMSPGDAYWELVSRNWEGLSEVSKANS